MLHVLFRSAQNVVVRASPCKIVVRSNQSARTSCCRQHITLCGCLQAVNTASSLGGCQQRVQFASNKAATRSLRAPQIKPSDDNGRRERPPAPLRRRELRARSAARRPIPRYRWRQRSPTMPGLRAIAATLASESRRWRIIEARSRTHRRDQTTQTRRHGHGRPQQMLQLPLSGVEEHAPAGH